MKKLIALLTVAGFLTFGISNYLLAQEENAQPVEEQTEQVEATPAAVEETTEPEVAATTTMETEEVADPTFHEVLKKQFIDGGWEFMSIILLILVLGLAVSIERIIYLTLSTTNTPRDG